MKIRAKNQSTAFIVITVDEMADLMMVAGKEIEGCIQVGTNGKSGRYTSYYGYSRPSVDVITGTIKANFPTRISFQVTSKIDSRTILERWALNNSLEWAYALYG